LRIHSFDSFLLSSNSFLSSLLSSLLSSESHLKSFLIPKYQAVSIPAHTATHHKTFCVSEAFFIQRPLYVFSHIHETVHFSFSSSPANHVLFISSSTHWILSRVSL